MRRGKGRTLRKRYSNSPYSSENMARACSVRLEISSAACTRPGRQVCSAHAEAVR